MSDVFSRLREHGARSFEQATAMPAEAYTSAEVLAAERHHIFGSAWTCVARTADVPAVGDWVTAEVADRSVVVVRHTDGEIVVHENVCIHRGATLLAGCGNAQRITCPYHAWTYRLDGQLVAAPYMHDSSEADGTPFAADRHQLVRVRSEVWQGFVFVTSDENAAPLAAQLRELDDVVGRYRLADYVPVHRAVEVWNTNWKHLVENFMDAYHVFKVHRDSFGAGGDSTLATMMHPGTDASAHHVVIDEPGGVFGVADAHNAHLEGTWRHTTVLAAVFPTHVMQVQPDWLWYLDIAPIGTGQVRIRWDVSVAPTTYAAQNDPEAYVRSVLRLLEQVNGEDRPVVEGVTEGMRRTGITNAPLSYLERNVFDFDRYVARRVGR
jgi:choline monooxygenase